MHQTDFLAIATTFAPAYVNHEMTLASLTLGLTLAMHWPAMPDQRSRIPPVHGTTFADTKVDLPDDLHGKAGILVLGFTQGSRDAVTSWGKKLAESYYDSSTVFYYEMPLLASVPKFLRGFVEGRIKASVSDRGKPHFLPITDDESEWRTLAHYCAPDDAYVLLVDERGIVRWQTQGLPTDAVCAALTQQINSLRPH